MKTSELIKKLQNLIDTDGDLEVVAKRDPNSPFTTNPLIQDAFVGRRLYTEEKCVLIYHD